MSGTKVCIACVEENKVCECHHENPVKELGLSHEASENSSFLHSVINMVGMLIGLGQLSMPYAVESGGWISIFLLISLGVLTTYTSHILGNCLRRNPKSKSYSDIGYSAFGLHGRLLASLFIYLEIFMALVSYTISLHDNIAAAFPATFTNLHNGSFPAAKLTAVAVAIALPSLWIRNLSSISYLSSGGIFMSAVIFMSVVYTAVFGGVIDDGRIPVLRLGNIPTVSGVYLFGFGGHIVFPNLYTSMKDPSKFTKITGSILDFATLNVQKMNLVNRKFADPRFKYYYRLKYMNYYYLHFFMEYCLHVKIIRVFLTSFLRIKMKNPLQAYSFTLRRKMYQRPRVVLNYRFYFILTGIPPNFQFLSFSIAPRFLSVTISVILPCAFYVKICWDGMSKFTRAANVVFVVFGCVLGVLGSFDSSKLLVNKLVRVHGN
ncbi:unnamed protein product [Brassica napus]|uniref:(rape) hypothetical protein n=1 Tax=Brassica napus TaxID=3708 RepID=A0A816WH60_BRANA|nr:unnamed protein product [Brassica napus]